MIVRFLLPLVLGAGILAGDVSQAQQVVPGADEAAGSIPLENLLQDLGRKYDCYFTLEEGWEEGSAMNAFSTSRVRLAGETTSLKQALDDVAKQVPNLRFEMAQRDRPIIHAIDKRLDKQSRYALGMTVPSYEFSGTTGELIADLAKRGIPIAPQTVFAVGRTIATDLSTRMTIKASGLTVRRLLSDFLPLKGYSRVIWTAATKLGSGAETVVNFKGPRS
jgi:hypothetical protein